MHCHNEFVDDARVLDFDQRLQVWPRHGDAVAVANEPLDALDRVIIEAWGMKVVPVEAWS